MVKFEPQPVLLSGTEYHQIVSLSTLRLCHQELLKSQASPDPLVQYGGGRSLHHLLISFHFISCLRHGHWEQLIWRAEFSGAVDGSAQPESCNVLWHCKGCQTILPHVLLPQPLPHCWISSVNNSPTNTQKNPALIPVFTNEAGLKITVKE